jgi:exopolysaccharide production protein ExoQ
MCDTAKSSPNRAAMDRPTVWEKVFLVIAFLCSSGAFLPLLLGFNYDPGSGMGTLTLDVVWVALFGIAFWLLLRLPHSAFAGLKKNWILLLLLGMPFASTLWSDRPLITFLASVALAGTVAVSLYITKRFTSQQLLGLLGWTLCLSGACSLFFVIFLPRYGIGTGDFAGEWQGIYAQKNELGRIMALGFLIYLLRFKFSRPRQVRYLFLSGFMLALVCLAQSATSLVVCLSAPAVLWGTRFAVAPSRHPVRRVLFVLFLPVSLLLASVLYFEQITNALGRDAGLTGRAALWALVTQAIQEQPFLGYGYEAFWRGGGDRAGEIWKEFGEFLYFSHNGMLEVSLALGLLGVIVVVVAFGVLGWRALRLIRVRFSLSTVWPLLFLWYLFVVNLTDDYLLRFHTLQTILFFVVVLGMPRDFQTAEAASPESRSKHRRLLLPIVNVLPRGNSGWNELGGSSTLGARK